MALEADGCLKSEGGDGGRRAEKSGGASARAEMCELAACARAASAELKGSRFIFLACTRLFSTGSLALRIAELTWKSWRRQRNTFAQQDRQRVMRSIGGTSSTKHG